MECKPIERRHIGCPKKRPVVGATHISALSTKEGRLCT
jgi:hypothetical protein